MQVIGSEETDSIVVFERADRLGGRLEVREIATPPTPSPLRGLTLWFSSRCYQNFTYNGTALEIGGSIIYTGQSVMLILLALKPLMDPQSLI
jgi:hypothetical protein